MSLHTRLVELGGGLVLVPLEGVEGEEECVGVPDDEAEDEDEELSVTKAARDGPGNVYCTGMSKTDGS